jgi:hypothetical protein
MAGWCVAMIRDSRTRTRHAHSHLYYEQTEIYLEKKNKNMIEKRISWLDWIYLGNTVVRFVMKILKGNRIMTR